VPERINGGQALAGLGAVLLLVSLFIDWFKPGVDGWTVFELNDLILAAIALFALAIALNPLLRLGLRLPVGSLPWAGAGALIIVLASVIQKPPAAHVGIDRTLDFAGGIWMALGGAVLILVGGILSTARVSLVISRTGASTPPPESRPPAGPATPPPTEPAPGPSDPATRPLPEQDV
jgi:hypothetical protein